MIARPPPPHLRPFVKAMWLSDGLAPGAEAGSSRERVLPTGTMHLVFRLSDDPLRLFRDEDDPEGHTVGHSFVGGARSTFYVRDIAKPARSIGIQFHPGAAERLLGVPADELMERHTPLEDLWGAAASEIRERLALARTPDSGFELLESLLTERLGQVRARALHPSVGRALELFTITADVAKVVDASGYSHRQFIACFRRAIGLTPKIYCRILRFQQVLGRVLEARRSGQGGQRGQGAQVMAPSWADLAMAAGYADQAHFNREFRAFSGISPGRYRGISPSWAHHVPIVAPAAGSHRFVDGHRERS